MCWCARGRSIVGPSANVQWPYAYRLNVSVQRQVTNNLAITAAYVGSLSHNLPFAVDLNYPSFVGATSANVQARRPNQSFGQILSMESGQTASYNGMQVSATQRMSHHLSFHAFYIYSKTFDHVQLHNSTRQAFAQNCDNMADVRGRAHTAN